MCTDRSHYSAPRGAAVWLGGLMTHKGCGLWVLSGFVCRPRLGLAVLLTVVGLLSVWPWEVVHAASPSAERLLPRGLLPNGFVLDESQSRTQGDVFAQRVYVGPQGTSWSVSASVLPSSESAWLNYRDRQRALGQLDVTVEFLSDLGDEAVTITDRAGGPLVAARTFVKAGRTVLSVIETARAGALDSTRRIRIARWMVNQARKVGQ